MSDEPMNPEEVLKSASHDDEENIVDGLTLEDALDPSIEPPVKVTKPANRMRVIRNMWIAIGGLTLLLILSMLISHGTKTADVNMNESEVATMRAELDARFAELNRQRAELNLPALAGQGDSLDQIAKRIRKDTEALISLMDGYQKGAEEKNRLLAEKNMALIRSEQIRESITAELARAQSHPAEDKRMREELTEALQKASRLADELAVARETIADLSIPADTGELEALQRQLEESNRARRFLEEQLDDLKKRPSDPRDSGLPELVE